MITITIDLLRERDRATPQVLIEARLIEATRSFSQSLGFEWGFNANMQMANLQNPQPVSLFTSPVGTPLAIPAATGAIPLAISMPATSPTAARDHRQQPLQQPAGPGRAHLRRREREPRPHTIGAEGDHPG